MWVSALSLSVILYVLLSCVFQTCSCSVCQAYCMCKCPVFIRRTLRLWCVCQAVLCVSVSGCVVCISVSCCAVCVSGCALFVRLCRVCHAVLFVSGYAVCVRLCCVCQAVLCVSCCAVCVMLCRVCQAVLFVPCCAVCVRLCCVCQAMHGQRTRSTVRNMAACWVLTPPECPVVPRSEACHR